MRLSVNDFDPGYRADIFSAKVTVLLDGVELKHCITADEEKGVVVIYKTDDKGRFLPSRDYQQAQTETLRGKVVIRCPWAWRCSPKDEIVAR